jgi:hypothetical protein
LTTLQPDFHLGIIGGCLAHQSGLGMCELYPRQLAKEVQAVTGARVQVHVARYADGEYVERLGELAALSRLDGVILHMRALVIRKTALIVKHRSGQTMTYALHPFAFGPRRAGWTEFESSDFAHCLRIRRKIAAEGLSAVRTGPRPLLPEDLHDEPLVPRRMFGLTVGQWNRLAGRVFGLEDWAIRDELAEVDRLRLVCDRAGVRLAILAPLPAPEAQWIQQFGQRLAQRLREQLAPYRVPVCSLDPTTVEEARRMFTRDGIHMNPSGHLAVARVLSDTVVDWLHEGR